MSVMVMSVIEQLESIRSAGGKRATDGLPDETVNRFATFDSDLVEAIEAAVEQFEMLRAEFPDFVAMDEIGTGGRHPVRTCELLRP